jgi:hypothetical protein
LTLNAGRPGAGRAGAQPPRRCHHGAPWRRRPARCRGADATKPQRRTLRARSSTRAGATSLVAPSAVCGSKPTIRRKARLEPVSVKSPAVAAISPRRSAASEAHEAGHRSAARQGHGIRDQHCGQLRGRSRNSVRARGESGGVEYLDAAAAERELATRLGVAHDPVDRRARGTSEVRELLPVSTARHRRRRPTPPPGAGRAARRARGAVVLSSDGSWQREEPC